MNYVDNLCAANARIKKYPLTVVHVWVGAMRNGQHSESFPHIDVSLWRFLLYCETQVNYYFNLSLFILVHLISCRSVIEILSATVMLIERLLPVPQ